MNLSAWELNRKAPHPKHLENIINYLGYVPNITSDFDKLGTQTKLYRIKHNLNLEEFLQITNIDSNVVSNLESLRFCKLPRTKVQAIKKALVKVPTSFYQ